MFCLDLEWREVVQRWIQWVSAWSNILLDRSSVNFIWNHNANYKDMGVLWKRFSVPGTKRKKLSQIIGVPFGYWTWRPERLRLEDVEVWLKPCVLEVRVKRLLFDAVCSFSLSGSCKERSLGVREALVTIHWNLPWCSSSVESVEISFAAVIPRQLFVLPC